MKTLFAALAFASILAPMTHAQQTLATLVDRNRVLLIFAGSGNDPRLGQQLTAFDHHAAELRTRDLIILPIVVQSGPPVTANVLRELQPPRISDEEQITMRRRFHIAQGDFAVILLGKDGTEKLRTSTPITLLRLNRTIDAMPGRQDEMRRQH